MCQNQSSVNQTDCESHCFVSCSCSWTLPSCTTETSPNWSCSLEVCWRRWTVQVQSSPPSSWTSLHASGTEIVSGSRTDRTGEIRSAHSPKHPLIWSHGCFAISLLLRLPVCSQRTRSRGSGTSPTTTSWSRSRALKPATYKEACSTGRMVKTSKTPNAWMCERVALQVFVCEPCNLPWFLRWPLCSAGPAHHLHAPALHQRHQTQLLWWEQSRLRDIHRGPLPVSSRSVSSPLIRLILCLERLHQRCASVTLTSGCDCFVPQWASWWPAWWRIYAITGSESSRDGGEKLAIARWSRP